MSRKCRKYTDIWAEKGFRYDDSPSSDTKLVLRMLDIFV